MDTGVDKLHPFLADKVVEEACFSAPEYPSFSRSLCPGGTATETGPGTGAPCVSGAQGCYHGTHVAGIIGAEKNGSGIPVAGTRPQTTAILNSP